RIRVRDEAIEDLDRGLDATGERQRLRPPERAHRERARGAAEIVVERVALHEAAAGQAARVVVEGGEEARVAGVHETERGQEEVRGVGVVAVERRGERAERRVEA